MRQAPQKFQINTIRKNPRDSVTRAQEQPLRLQQTTPRRQNPDMVQAQQINRSNLYNEGSPDGRKNAVPPGFNGTVVMSRRLNKRGQNRDSILKNSGVQTYRGGDQQQSNGQQQYFSQTRPNMPVEIPQNQQQQVLTTLNSPRAPNQGNMVTESLGNAHQVASSQQPRYKASRNLPTIPTLRMPAQIKQQSNNFKNRNDDRNMDKGSARIRLASISNSHDISNNNNNNTQNPTARGVVVPNYQKVPGGQQQTINNIKNYNNYHFEIKQNLPTSGQQMPEEQKSMEKLVNGQQFQAQSYDSSNVNQAAQMQNMMITKRPHHQSSYNNVQIVNPKKKVFKQNNQSIDIKRSYNHINLSNQRSAEFNSNLRNKFLMTVQRPQDLSIVHQNNSSLDKRNRISPKFSPGLSSLAAAAANSTLEQPKKAKISFPMDPRSALVHMSKSLLSIEKQEILEYETVFYLNVQERKGVRAVTPDGVDNNGFDNDKGEYICDIRDHIAYRFEVVKRLGQGSFGQVFKCFDHKKKETSALKILRNKKRLYKQGLIENKILEILRENDPEDKKNIIRVRESFVFRKHLILVFEMLSMNLYEFIKMNNFQGVSVGLVRRFSIQLLVALHYMKEHQIVHCDMKPENILLRKPNKSGIKVIDVGSGTFESEQFYTYIQSRFYRAPEIMLGIKYTPAIDMWSLGCILYELFVGFPLFSGEDEREQMQCIMEVKGVPPRSLIVLSSRRRVFFDDDYQPIATPNSKGRVRKPNTKSLERLMKCEDPLFVDFIDKCLEWKPDKRLTPESAFQHSWVKAGIKELKLKIEQQAQTNRSKPSQAERSNKELLFSQESQQFNSLKSALPNIGGSQSSRATGTHNSISNKDKSIASPTSNSKPNLQASQQLLVNNASISSKFPTIQ